MVFLHFLSRSKLMRSLVSAVVLFVFSASQVAAGEFVPFKGTTSHEYSFAPIGVDDRCEDGAIFAVLGMGVGNGTHLGKFTETLDVTYFTCDGSFFGTSILTAANKDEVHTSYTGQDQPGDPDDPITLVLANGTIDGGSGRFEGATGSFAARELRFLTSETTSAAEQEFTGLISSVGSTRSARAVPEPGSMSLALAGLLALALRARCGTNGR
jgi:hypothetical protein